MANFSLSVSMMNYNHSQYICEALESILNQSYKSIEVIVTDDASTDNSVEIIKKFVKRNSVIRFIQNEKNKGIFYNANRFLDIACGDYVYFAAADDRILPCFFEKSMKMLIQYPHAGLCCAESVAIDNNTGAIIERTLDIINSSLYFSPAMVAELLRNTPFYIEGRAAVIKRKLLIENGKFKSDLRLYSDWLLWLLVAFRHGVCYIPETLTAFRALPDSYFASERKNKISRYKIIERMLFMLKTQEYKDVLPLFRRSCVLNEIYLEGIFYIILRNPELWDFLSVAAIRKSLSYKILNRLSLLTFPLIKNIYRDIRNKNMKCNSDKIIKKTNIKS